MKQPIDEILSIMERLRDPESGCPWDRKQDFASIAPYTIEEAYEVADAIAQQDYDALRDELGDLLLQVVYHSQMAAEQTLFDFNDVVRGICNKMVVRHPHVFDTVDTDASLDRSQQWEQDKEKERRAKGHTSVMDGIAGNLPALSLAHKLQVRAATTGFDWKEPEAVLAKVDEEVNEVREEATSKPINHQKLTGEIGDLLFTVVNLARHYHINPESALRVAVTKFENRFRQLEQQLALNNDGEVRAATAEEMEQAWEQIKQREKSSD